MTAAGLLEAHGLPHGPLFLATEGEDNIVYIGPEHVVRMRGPWPYDHRLERELAETGLALGVRTARCIAADECWSIWERLPGRNQGTGDFVSPGFYRDLLQDVAKLHTRVAPSGTQWSSLRVERAKEAVAQIEGLSLEDRSFIGALAMPRVRLLTFAHGDAHPENTMVSDEGDYVGLIDWANAGWWPPEIDTALLALEGLRYAHANRPEELDWDMVEYLSLTTMTYVVGNGWLPVTELKETIAFWRQVR